MNNGMRRFKQASSAISMPIQQPSLRRGKGQDQALYRWPCNGLRLRQGLKILEACSRPPSPRKWGTAKPVGGQAHRRPVIISPRWHSGWGASLRARWSMTTDHPAHLRGHYGP